MALGFRIRKTVIFLAPSVWQSTEECVVTQEQFLSKRQRYQPISLPQDFSDEELARDWN